MKNYTFTFTEQEINAILAALGKEPFINVAQVINNIHQQAAEQNKSDENKVVKEDVTEN